MARRFTAVLVKLGIDISVQICKAQCPAALTKLPLIASLQRFDAAVKEV